MAGGVAEAISRPSPDSAFSDPKKTMTSHVSKVELEEDQFQDFPDLLDCVTVDEVGDVNDFPSAPAPDAVATDTTVMVDKDDDLEEKGIKDPMDRKNRRIRPRPICRNFIKGDCTWGVKCRFIHPRVNDKGKDSLFSKPELSSPDRALPGAPRPGESPDDDTDSPTVPTAGQEDATPQENENPVPGEKRRTRRHSLQILGEKSEAKEYFEEVHNCKGALIRLYCKLCKCNIQRDYVENHHESKIHTRMLELKREFDAKKLKRDDSDEKTGSKDEDQQDIKESPARGKDSHKEDSSPQQNGTYDYLVDVLYDGTAIDLFCTLCESTLNGRSARYVETHLTGRMHRRLLESGLIVGNKRVDRKIEIFSEDESCVVGVDGKSPDDLYCALCECRTSGRKDLHLKGRQHIASVWKKLKEEKLKHNTDQQLQDFPLDMRDFVTVDEVGDVAFLPLSAPPHAVVTDTEEAGDAVVAMETSEVVEEQSAQAEATPTEAMPAEDTTPVFLEDTPQESPSHGKDSHVLTADKEDSSPQQNGTYDYLVDVLYDGAAIDLFCTLCENTLNSRHAISVDKHLTGRMHRQLLESVLNVRKKRVDKKIEIFSEDESCIVGVDGKSPDDLYCSLCECRTSGRRDLHLNGKQHIASVWKKLKEERLKDNTDRIQKKISSQDEAAGEPLSKDQQLQDFPLDMGDFVTVDEVGDVAGLPLPAPPRAVATDTEEAGDAVVATETSEVVEEQSAQAEATPTETMQTEATSTGVPEDTPQASPGPVTMATAAPETSEPRSPTLSPLVTAQQPHWPPVPQAMCSSEQLDTPVAQPVAAKRLMSQEDESREEEPTQKKAKTQAATADQPPPFDPDSAVGMDFLVRSGFFCKLCRRFFTGGRESELNHCKSQQHYDNWQKYVKTRKTTS